MLTSSSDHARRLGRSNVVARTRRAAAPVSVAVTFMLALGVGACSDDGPIKPPANADCGGVSTSVVSLERLEGRVITGDAVHCVALAGGGANYLVIPQLAGAALPYGGYGFRIGDPTASPTVSLFDGASFQALRESGSERSDAQARLDAHLRARELEWSAARRDADVTATSGAGPRRPQTTAPDTLRRFSILSTLNATPAWAPVDARLRFAGARVLLYVDTLAATVFTDAELLAMGTLYDDALAPRVFATFGDGSDVDANGRLLFVLTPTVNAMVTAAECPTRGYVRGFFYSHDLASSAPTSTRGEVFYGFVPDPTGRWSCAHTKADVASNLPPTFMHELQHMISFGAHAIIRGGAGEEPWLNEGLSHMAEEIGSLYWEQRFPAPSGRTVPTQIFPDSAAAYINPNLLYSYRFLFSSAFYSLTSCAPGTFCSLSERSGTWLLLRWIADHKGETVFRELVQTSLTGRANLEAVSGETIAALLGDFAITVATDSLEGVARDRTPVRYRFASRNFRGIYRKLFEAYGVAGGVGRPYPIEPLSLSAGASLTGTMRPGTFLAYRLSVGASTPTALIRFSVPDGSAFQASSGAQVSIFRLP